MPTVRHDDQADSRVVYTRESKPWLYIRRKHLVYMVQNLCSRLILAEGFWDGLIPAAAYLGRESVRIVFAQAIVARCKCNYPKTRHRNKLPHHWTDLATN